VHNSIEVAGLGKRYSVGGRSGALLLTEVLANRMRGRRAAMGEVFWALQDVSFTVGHGELVGIIGRNGAGKTTLLRILARITAPTAGVARVRGRLSALLDVGTGFHDELTGQENVFLSGAILGMSRNDVRAQFDQIVAFSGVERFLETPLKRYSAGMRLRLAFAVAAHLEPEVLVIDEALAVGDAEFQRRCIGRMEDLQRSGRTVVFVSHDLGAIGRLCERTLWLDRGRIAFDGPTHETLRRYFDAVGRIDAGRVELETDPHLPVALKSVWITAGDGAPISEPLRYEAAVLRLRVDVRERIPGLDVGFYVADSTGVRVLEDTLRVAEPGSALGSAPGEAEVQVTLPGVLRADDYLVGIYIYAGHDYWVVEEPLRFRVLPAQGESDDGIRPSVRPRLSWSVDAIVAEGTL
jgi:ABC-2 type transport system ATP-binding protein/lipopolysaccharide transport system ATP-binding protein